jgi:hypothetical protein
MAAVESKPSDKTTQLPSLHLDRTLVAPGKRGGHIRVERYGEGA